VTATPALLAAAAGVAVGHAVLPDHWVPLAVLSRTRHYRLARVARLSAAAAIAHVTVSLVLGALIIVIGLQFRSAVEQAQNLVIGGLLVATGLLFAVFELTGRKPGHSHGPDGSHAAKAGAEHDHLHDHEPEHAHAHAHGAPGHTHDPDGRDRLGGVAGLLVPFGAAASPDLTILPVFVAATAAGVAAAVGALLVFSVVTIAMIVGLTVVVTFGGYQVRGAWLDRWGNATTALVLIVVGGLVLTGVI
jgi:nickel/cobalt transporter (NicO) family protein